MVAALINPKDLVGQAVFSTAFSAHALSRSTILDGGSAVHLVNTTDLIVPGSFVKLTEGETVDAGTQAIPVTGIGKRLLKGILNTGSSVKGDLMLEDVRVVPGFHTNIVSESKLRNSGIWYLGYDRTLRYGSMEENVPLMNLQPLFNLLFIEYKQVTRYPSDPLTVNAVAKSTKPQERSGDHELWHLRSGHLGKRALEALVRAAQNVEIVGTRRSECDHCSTAHATQVISRRPKEKSPRPFFRISWDLFDFPTGRLHEEWALIIKEDYSGKLYNYNLLSKTLSSIILIIKTFIIQVKRKYK
jgi:hypothetical protein